MNSHVPIDIIVYIGHIDYSAEANSAGERGKQMQMTGNTVLITGGTSGIGLELAMQLSALGNIVIITGRSQEKLDAIRRDQPELIVMQSDVSDPVAIGELQARVTRDYPKLNILVNNAGVMRKINLQDRGTDLEDLSREIDTNLTGPVRMVKQFLPQLKAQPFSAIVNVSSALAFIPFPISPIYSATKAGIHAFTKALRVQLKNTNVQVFELAPPSTQTPLQDAFSPTDVKASANMDVRVLGKKAIEGLRRDKLEIRPGTANVLSWLSRIAPTLGLKLTSGPMDAMLEQTRS